MAKNKKNLFKWSENEVFNYELIKEADKNKSHLEKRKEEINKGKLSCSEWWLCRKNH